MSDPAAEAAEFVANNWKWITPVATTLIGGGLTSYSGYRRRKAKRKTRDEISDLSDEEMRNLLEPYEDELKMRKGPNSEWEGDIKHHVYNLFHPDKAGKKDAYLEKVREENLEL